jgi:hypothetical protein
MSKKTKVDRLYVDRKDLDDWKRLKDIDSPFAKSDNKDIFIAAMVVGYHDGSKIELGRGRKEGYFFSDNLKPNELALIRAIAVSEEGNLNVLMDESKVFSIAEQYATGGVKLLKNKVFSGEYGSYAKKLESDLLKEYDEIAQRSSKKSKTLEELDDVPVADLIAGGETDKVVFKSSLIWDIKKKQPSKDTKIAVARAISSFLNCEGGFLLIGVNNDGSLIGLNNDLAQSHGSFDEFERTFTNAINNYLGRVNRPLVSIRYEKVDDKDIVVVRVKPSPHEVFLKIEDKEKFYIRSGNTSQELDISEATQYIKEHWPEN